MTTHHRTSVYETELPRWFFVVTFPVSRGEVIAIHLAWARYWCHRRMLSPEPGRYEISRTSWLRRWLYGDERLTICRTGDVMERSGA